jgi:4-hydroxybenzoate polyprenyltransferase
MVFSFFRRSADAVFLSRPLLWIPVWGYCIFGYCSGLTFLHGFNLTAAWRLSLYPAVWMFVFSCSVGAVYVINQIADREVDAKNTGFPLLAKGGIPLWLARGTAGALAMASIFLPFFSRPIVSLFSVLSLTVGLVYSLKPTYLSGRFFLDFLSNAIGFAFIAFGVGWHLSGATFGPMFVFSCAPYFLLMCAGSISSTLPDIEGDRSCGKKTTAVTIGSRPAHVIASLFIVAGCVMAFFMHDWVAAFCAGVAVPLYIVHLIRNTVSSMEATYKIGGLAMMLAAAVIFPLLAPVSLAALIATIFYFRLRYHVKYPSLVPADSSR